MPDILIVDDEPLLLMMLADMLEDEGYEVQTASDGAAALESVRAAPPALLITDFMMPGMTGLDLARAIRADERLSRLPIILVSGAQGGIAREQPELFQAVFDKPCSNSLLLETVTGYVRTARPFQKHGQAIAGPVIP